MMARRSLAIALRQVYLMQGSVTRVLPMFAWTGLDIAVWGWTSKYLSSLSPQGPSLGVQLLGAVVLWNFLTRVMHGVTTSFLEDVWSRNFLNLFATPMSVFEYLNGLLLTSFVTSSVGLASMSAVAVFLFDLSPRQLGLVLVPGLAVLLLCGLALGILGCATVLRFGPAAEWLVWPLPMILTPFAGVFYPQRVLPGWMQHVAQGVAPAYVFEALRQRLDGAAWVWTPWLISLPLAMGYLAIAYGLFALTYRYAVRVGLIARYSAESVN